MITTLASPGERSLPKKPPLPEPVFAVGSMEYEEQQKRLAPIAEPENN
jgi:hypothetical protein